MGQLNNTTASRSARPDRPPTQAEIHAARKQHAKLFGAADNRDPVLVDDVPVGSMLQHWGLPNQTPFLLLGMDGERIVATTENGCVVGFVRDAWFALVALPSDERAEMCRQAMDRVLRLQRRLSNIFAQSESIPDPHGKQPPAPNAQMPGPPAPAGAGNPKL